MVPKLCRFLKIHLTKYLKVLSDEWFSVTWGHFTLSDSSLGELPSSRSRVGLLLYQCPCLGLNVYQPANQNSRKYQVDIILQLASLQLECDHSSITSFHFSLQSFKIIIKTQLEVPVMQTDDTDFHKARQRHTYAHLYNYYIFAIFIPKTDCFT